MGDALINWLIVRASGVHLYLLVLDAFATWVVVKGILWETKGPPSVQKVAHRLVVWGVAAETLIILGLFWFDERISDGQKSQIEVQQSAIVQQGLTILLQQDQIIGLEKANEALSAKEQETETAAAKAMERAAQLEKEAAEAKLAIAAAEARAAEASQKAVEAQLALERFKAPRSLTQADQLAMIPALLAYVPQEYALSVGQGQEAENLLCQLDSVLQRAGWTKIDPFGSVHVDTDCGTVGVNTASGVHIRIPAGTPFTPGHGANAAASLLAAMLNAAGIAAFPALDPKNIPKANVISLMVGVKP